MSVTSLHDFVLTNFLFHFYTYRIYYFLKMAMANNRILDDDGKMNDQIMSKNVKSLEFEIHKACEKGDAKKFLELINRVLLETR